MPDDGCSGWSFFNPMCHIGEGVEAIIGSAIENMANAVMEAVGKALASLGTIWVHLGTPNLTGSGGPSSISAGSSAPNSGNITTVLSYVTWISFAVAVLSLFALGAIIATRMRAGEGIAAVGKLGLVLGAVVLISAASAIVSGLMPSGPNNASGAVLFLQSSLWWYMGAAAIVSVMIGGARMAWEQRAEPGREALKSLLTLVVVAGTGTTIIGLLVAAADSFSAWIINSSLNCQVNVEGSTCFGENMVSLLALTSGPAGGLGAILIIILGLIAILATIFQVVLMVARGGLLVILTGVLPLSASATNTEMGKQWFKKCVSWLLAFILYKPAAAIVYAAAFQLAGTNVFSDDGSGLLAVLTGLMLMIIALFALPALLRFVTPMVGAMAGGAGGAMAAGAMAALPTGAATVGRLASGSGSGGAVRSSGADGSSGDRSTAGPSGSSKTSGSTVTTGDFSSQVSRGVSSSGALGESNGSSVGVSGELLASRAASGGGGGGTAAAGAAAGPIGVATSAILEIGKSAGQAAAAAAQNLGEQSTGESGGPDGSR